MGTVRPAATCSECNKVHDRGNTKDRKARKQRMLKRFGDGLVCRCAYCGQRLTHKRLEADRIVPGGRYIDANLIPACKPCNRNRGDMSFDDYVATLAEADRQRALEFFAKVPCA